MRRESGLSGDQTTGKRLSLGVADSTGPLAPSAIQPFTHSTQPRANPGNRQINLLVAQKNRCQRDTRHAPQRHAQQPPTLRRGRAGVLIARS